VAEFTPPPLQLLPWWMSSPAAAATSPLVDEFTPPPGNSPQGGIAQQKSLGKIRNILDIVRAIQCFTLDKT
jgi:hypothetical protein